MLLVEIFQPLGTSCTGVDKEVFLEKKSRMF